MTEKKRKGLKNKGLRNLRKEKKRRKGCKVFGVTKKEEKLQLYIICVFSQYCMHVFQRFLIIKFFT
jgi:hypothetical protein